MLDVCQKRQQVSFVDFPFQAIYNSEVLSVFTYLKREALAKGNNVLQRGTVLDNKFSAETLFTILN